ncbi:MAG TPA: Calx-beta domain-containing protein, partial [Polyangiales bacterium]
MSMGLHLGAARLVAGFLCATSAACGATRGSGSQSARDAMSGGEQDAAGEDALDAGPGARVDSGSEVPVDAASSEDRPSTTLDAAGQVPGHAELRAGFRGASASTWEGTGLWSVEVTLSQPADTALTLELITGGSAEAGRDYQLETSRLEIPVGAQSARVTIRILDDAAIEASEVLSLSLAKVQPVASFQLRIADDDDTRWPGDAAVTSADAARAYTGANLSGLAYQPGAAAGGATLWMVRNSPSQLYRLAQSGSLYVPSSANDFSQGKTLTFPGGGGAPDAEDITWADRSSPLIYVISERDGNGDSAPAILAYDTSAPGTSLRAQRGWDLSADLDSLDLDANLGPEAITWVPDSYLVSAGFRDEARGVTYQPDRYPNHGGGLFLVGIEQTGGIYAYALDHTSGKPVRVAQIESGMPGVMALEFDRDVNYLWAWCDDACGNQATLLRVEDNPAS